MRFPTNCNSANCQIQANRCWVTAKMKTIQCCNVFNFSFVNSFRLQIYSRCTRTNNNERFDLGSTSLSPLPVSWAAHQQWERDVLTCSTTVCSVTMWQWWWTVLHEQPKPFLWARFAVRALFCFIHWLLSTRQTGHLFCYWDNSFDSDFNMYCLLNSVFDRIIYYSI